MGKRDAILAMVVNPRHRWLAAYDNVRNVRGNANLVAFDTRDPMVARAIVAYWQAPARWRPSRAWQA